MNNPIIKLRGLSKHYKNKIAVDNLSLEINKGEIFGLLGPNGAGKTTTILMLLGLSEPTSGQAHVCGHDATRNPIAVKKKVGYLPDNLGFYGNMTALENLSFVGRLNGFSEREAEAKAIELLEIVGLKNNANQKTTTFSRGMKQRLGLADVLIKEPEVIILDEPTLGIDPSGVKDFLALIKKLNEEQQLTVLLSSHHLHHVQQICDRVGIFVAGKLLASGDIPSLSKQLFNKNGYVTLLRLQNSAEATTQLKYDIESLPGVQEVIMTGNELEVISVQEQTAEMVKHVVGKGYGLVGVEQKTYGLDEIYLEYFKNEKNQDVSNEKSKRVSKKTFFKRK
ncbi:ABC transporter ATP-binding protein [Sphingobacterium yanglingense]|uniref:ABC-2 type transport system ATP-binding protein n=1 Tax=Sphingobacterium yanglingense TaxID=1437280 RepID=A0A4R6WHR7_9SPHI|nr:ABC transporter ATP-binding protein [Sphingobacterium yanglingense]TDQ77947.1 ABC-2 type transport system ATP-binding protein [Sphingobacterium yanglingense]